MNFVKPFFLLSLSVLMLSISSFGSFYVWQTIKTQRNEYFLDAFKVELARIAYNNSISRAPMFYHPGEAPRDIRPTVIRPRSIAQIKAEMKSEGHGDSAIEMLYTQAEKQFLNLK